MCPSLFNFEDVTTTTTIYYLTTTSNLVQLESWSLAQFAVFFMQILALILFVMFEQSGEKLLILYPTLLCPKDVTTTTTVH